MCMVEWTYEILIFNISTHHLNDESDMIFSSTCKFLYFTKLPSALWKRIFYKHQKRL